MSNHKQSKKLRQIDSTGKGGVEIQHSEEGILPPVDDLIKLEKINPGTVDKFMTLAEKDQDHYIKNDKDFFMTIHKTTNNGILAGLIGFLTINGLAVYMVSKGYSSEGLGIVISELIAGLIAFIKIRK